MGVAFEAWLLTLKPFGSPPREQTNTDLISVLFILSVNSPASCINLNGRIAWFMTMRNLLDERMGKKERKGKAIHIWLGAL